MKPRTTDTYMNVRVSSALLARLDAQCERRTYSRSALIRIALERFLPEIEDESDTLDAEILNDRWRSENAR